MLYVGYSLVWGSEGNRKFFKAGIDFSYLHVMYFFLSHHYFFLKSFELDQYFYGLMTICSYCWVFGRYIKNSSQQTGLLLVWEAAGMVFTCIYEISLWALFALPLASSRLTCMTASNVWNNPAECELLYWTSGGRPPLLQVPCVWASPKMKAGYWKEHDYLALIELLKSVLTVTRSEQTPTSPLHYYFCIYIMLCHVSNLL